jgi:hypothetical protein
MRSSGSTEDIMPERFHGSRHGGVHTFRETARVPGRFRVNLGRVGGIDTFAFLVVQ